MRMLRCVLNDLTIQRRSGFWAVYAILSALYIALLAFIPEHYVADALVFILFADPCALGFYFVGGFSYLERDDGTLAAVSISPLDWREYLAARTISFSVLAVGASAAAAIPISLLRGSTALSPASLLIGVGLGAAFFTLVGLLPAARFKTVNDYIVAAELWLLPFLPPLLARFGLIPNLAVWRFLPSGAMLELLDLGVRAGGTGMAVSASALSGPTLVLVAWTAAAWFVCARSFKKNLIDRLGGSS